MKIAFCNRPSYDNPLGGDAVQMLKTKEYLEKKYEIEIIIITDPEHITKEFDIVHVFNFVSVKITGKFIYKAKSLNIPVISSSIFWDYSYATDRIVNFYIFKSHLSEWCRILIKYTTILSSSILGRGSFTKIFKRRLNSFIQLSDFVLPNSKEEADLLLKFVNLSESSLKNKIRVVYNATEPCNNIEKLNKEEFFKKYKIPSDFILQVGRIEPVKNQINLLYSLRNDKEIPIVFLGKEVNKTYSDKLRKFANKRGNVYFINSVPHNEVFHFYNYAALHVLLSLRESPGLVSLEALANKCPVVISDSHYTPVSTYFENQPYIVNPFNIKEINKTIKVAYNERKLGEFDINKFSWTNVADQTYSVYQEVFNK